MDAPMACQSVAPDGVQSFLCASTHVCTHLISSSQSSWHRLGSTLPLLRAFLSLQLERDGCPETSHCTSMSLTELTSINNNSFDSSTPLWRHRGSPGRWCSAHSRYSVNICSTLANKAHSTWLLSNAQSGKYVYLPSFPERYWGGGGTHLLAFRKLSDKKTPWGSDAGSHCSPSMMMSDGWDPRMRSLVFSHLTLPRITSFQLLKPP